MDDHSVIDVRTAKDVLDAVKRIGRTSEEAIVLIADCLSTDWCGAKQSWPLRKKRVREFLQAVIDVAGKEV